MRKHDCILTINAGSSSIRFAQYTKQNELQQNFSGKIEGIGSKNAIFTINQNNDKREKEIDASNFHNATISLIDWFEKQAWFNNVKAIGHRIVYGIKHTHAEIIMDDLLKELNNITGYDPDHLPAEIDIIQTIQKKHSQLLQVACFDTAFHTTIPPVAKTFAIPKKYYDEGIQRYGFHGISYCYLMQELRKQNKAEANGKIILAHLGSGASIAAVKAGKCLDTSMGFTPADGIVMSTRSGDLDPGVAWYLMQQGMDANAFNDLINHQSGLLGISGLSADMKVLLQHEKDNKDAALAIDIFCYQIKKYIGAYTAALGGLDTLIFTGGIGENASVIRSRICAGFGYAGISLNEDKNNKNERLISNNKSKIKVHVIPTNEELMMAHFVDNILKNRR
ncbi:MAG: acetate/propionate family kinase [Puia sp.]